MTLSPLNRPRGLSSSKWKNLESSVLFPTGFALLVCVSSAYGPNTLVLYLPLL